MPGAPTTRTLPGWLAAARPERFDGRVGELELIDDRFARVLDGHRCLVCVTGEPGSGKTSLIAAAADGIVRDNPATTVLAGRCSENGVVPFEPFAQIVGQLLAVHPPVDRDATNDLRRLAAGETLVSDVGDFDQPTLARNRLFDLVAAALRHVADQGPLVVVLDDFHWAELPTLALLEHLVIANADVPILVLCAFRATAPDRSDEVQDTMARLYRHQDVGRVELAGLSTDDVAAYVRHRAPVPEERVREATGMLVARTGGNPFYLNEVWADLERRGGIDALGPADRVPATVADTIIQRLERLGPQVCGVVELGAVIGATFELRVLIVVAHDTSDSILSALDRAVDAGLLTEDPSRRGAYAFVHALTRQAVLDQLATSVRLTLHADVATAMEQEVAGPVAAPLLAQHYLAASALGYQGQARRWCIAAAKLAERSLAFEDAAHWYQHAAELVDTDAEQRASLLLSAGGAFTRASQFTKARALYAVVAQDRTSPLQLDAAIGFEDAMWRDGQLGPRAAEILTGAIRLDRSPGQDPRSICAQASLARALSLSGDAERARVVAVRAVQQARDLGDEQVLLHALTTSFWQGTGPYDLDGQLERTGEAQQLAIAVGDHLSLGEAYTFRAMAAYATGDATLFGACVAGSRREMATTTLAYYQLVYLHLSAAEAFLKGDFANAERYAAKSLTQDRPGERLSEGPYGVKTYLIKRETGALGGLRSRFDGSEPLTGLWVPALLALYTDLGVEAGMRRALSLLLARDLSSLADQAQWPMELVFMVEAALALEDPEPAQLLRPYLEVFTGTNIFSGTLIAVFGAADRYLGRIDALLGDTDAARDHLNAALSLDRRTRSVVHITESLARLAIFEAAHDNATAAAAFAREATELAEPIGQHRIMNLVSDIPALPHAQPDGLTGREIDVLRLLAAGRSNREIGEALAISANTAANHVRSILGKTNCANRTQAAVHAAELGLL